MSTEPGPGTGESAAHHERVEADALGEVRIPDGVLWGAQTQRAVENFDVSGRPVDRAIVQALALIKAQVAADNGRSGLLEPDVAAAIRTAALEVADGRWDDQFPVDVFQTGSGTSTNMNVNEVVARLAGESGLTVHPNDDVNAGQSSNDTFPSAVRLAVAREIQDRLLAECERLRRSLDDRARDNDTVVKAGRTHLMDATPVTLGQELQGHASQIAQAAERIASVLPRVCRLPLGGTATGTGLNAPPGMAAAVVATLADATGLPLVEAPDHFAAQGAADDLVELSGTVRVLGVALTKVANDLRWMASGPATGLGEVSLPELQPGSSIMPGKVNPVACEAVLQVAAQIHGHDACIAHAGSQGNFELLVMQPVIGQCLLDAVRLAAAGCRLLATRAVDGLVANVETCARHARSTPALATALAPVIGHDVAASVVHESLRSGASIHDVVVGRGLLEADEAHRLLDVEEMARPHRRDESRDRTDPHLHTTAERTMMESEPSGAPDVSGTAAPAGLTILDALERASEEGYEASFSATDDGDLECEQGRHRVNPAAVHVERLWRVEGASDAADMNLVCALSCPRCGAAGSLVLGYGPNASAADDAVSRHLLTEGATEPGTSPRSAAPPQG